MHPWLVRSPTLNALPVANKRYQDHEVWIPFKAYILHDIQVKRQLLRSPNNAEILEVRRWASSIISRSIRSIFHEIAKVPKVVGLLRKSRY